MDIHALTLAELTSAQKLAAELFPWEDEHQEALKTAVSGGGGDSFLASRGLQSVRSWVATEAGRLSGLVTFYEYWNTSDETWLAWFGLASGARGHGKGADLLDWAISCAAKERKTALRLWTTVEEEYAAALRLYARRGFRPELQPALPGEDWQTVVLSLGLNGHVPLPWSARCKGAPLCGRVIPAVAA